MNEIKVKLELNNNNNASADHHRVTLPKRFYY